MGCCLDGDCREGAFGGYWGLGGFDLWANGGVERQWLAIRGGGGGNRMRRGADYWRERRGGVRVGRFCESGRGMPRMKPAEGMCLTCCLSGRGIAISRRWLYSRRNLREGVAERLGRYCRRFWRAREIVYWVACGVTRRWQAASVWRVSVLRPESERGVTALVSRRVARGANLVTLRHGRSGA